LYRIQIREIKVKAFSLYSKAKIDGHGLMNITSGT